MEKCDQMFFALLRAAMTGGGFEATPTEAEWTAIYQTARKQSLTGVVYTAVARLDKAQQPPMALAMQWMSEAETTRGLNELLNREAARLTRLFADEGRQTAILKGQANARLYPDKLSRQPGDIDIWVEGGKESVIALLERMRLIDGIGKSATERKAMASYHHVHIPATKDGVVVEVHFRPSSGNFNPITNRRLQRWVAQEIATVTKVDEGFNVPSVKFALVMQLSHIQRHFLSGGIGLRHVCDYYWLLQNATAEERQTVTGLLKRFGLSHTAGALMWVLDEVLRLDAALMLGQADSYRGEWLLREIMAGGNFGHYAGRRQQGVFRRVWESQKRSLRLMRFDFQEMMCTELRFWRAVAVTLPERIRRRSWSLAEANKRDGIEHTGVRNNVQLHTVPDPMCKYKVIESPK